VFVRKIARKRNGESGAALIEFSFVLLPLLAFLFMMMDVAWIFFGWACIQEGAREGVRYAVAGWQGQTEDSLDTATKLVVQQYSFGFAKPANVTIDYCPSDGYASSGPPACLDGTAGAVAVGNVVKVTVQSASIGTFGPIFRTWSPIHVSASAADILQ
jgi:Flp pilus assembly protein TadG